MGGSLASKLIQEHLVEGTMEVGEEIALKIDQTLTQDATGTLAYLQFEAMDIPKVETDLSVSYVDHNLLQTDNRSADDHRYLQSVAAKYGIYFSGPGNGVSHQVHLERFSVPGKSLLGSDSHTSTNGGMGMLAMGAGGLDVALAMAGYPFYLKMPRIVGIELEGKLKPWVSAKDVILEVLRLLKVKGGLDRLLEYFGSGVEKLDVPSRATICNMGTEVGATTSLFPSDKNTKSFLKMQGREDVWRRLRADEDAEYDEILRIDLGELEPLIAQPSSPDRVVRVRDVEGEEVSQVIIGSCSNSSLRDLSVVAKILKGKKVHPGVSFEINPGSRQILQNLGKHSGFLSILGAGARVQQPGCFGCIGMGQAPATDSTSLRTFPRNFPGRSGTEGDRVYLCSPEVAAASALEGRITDPRSLGTYPTISPYERLLIDDTMIISPSKSPEKIRILRGPNIKPLPSMKPLQEEITGDVLIKLGDNITTDDIMPAGSGILPLRSNIPAISDYVFSKIDPDFSKRSKKGGGGFIVGGENYGQGSSREHAALAPKYLGVKGVLAKSFARIHKSNLINFGILPLEFRKMEDYEKIRPGSRIKIIRPRKDIKSGHKQLSAEIDGRSTNLNLNCTERERMIILSGGLLMYVKNL